MKVKGILFDYDGTIMDTAPLIIASYRELFRLHRTVEEFDEQKQLAVQGPSLKEMFEKYFPGLDVEELITEYRTYQNAHVQELLRLFPDTKEVLDYFEEMGMPMGLVSSRKTDIMTYHLEFMVLKKYFSIVIGTDQVKKDKPDPEGILKACDLWKVDPKDCVYVGDSLTDILAGKAAGTYTIAVVSNPKKEEALKQTNPDELVLELKSLTQLINVL